MNTYTDTQLKQALARMLPEKIKLKIDDTFEWIHNDDEVLDTELLHLCWLVEETLGYKHCEYHTALIKIMPNGAGVHVMSYHATWQQRTIALAIVKGIEI